MNGIPSALYNRLRQALLDCGPFGNDSQLSNVFAHPKLRPWRHSVPQASTPADRVDATIAFLAEKRRSDTKENALVLLLHVMRERLDPADDCHSRLTKLAGELGQVLGGALPAVQIEPEANPAGQPMPFIAADEKLLACTRSVCRASVPRILGTCVERVPTGTGWLLAPELALTCWHVMEARSLWDVPISDADLQRQIQNSLFTFGFTLPGQGTEYSVAALECHSADLDYALLRLSDRPDAPLRQRGFLAFDEHAPLTTQTQLFVIQHPQGQPQQRSAGFFIRHTSDQNHILHNAPTLPGTSGAPVLNVTNWRVVALHNGENEAEQSREGTLIKAILADLKQRRPHLYDEIVDAQNAKE